MTDKEIKYYVEYYNVKVAEILNTSQMTIQLDFSRALHTAGTCRRISNQTAKIKISRNLANMRSEHETKNTIVHELCHAYDNNHSKHGHNWKRIAQIVGNELGFNITRAYHVSAELANKIATSQRTASPVALIEVPELNYKKYIYKKCRGYYDEYRGWTLNFKGKKYSLVFTKLR